MKRALIFDFALICALAAGVPLLAGATRAAAQEQQQAALFPPTRFDGVYSVDAVTQDGSCAKAHFTVQVAHGQVASISPNDENITAIGIVESDGVVSLTFRGGVSQIAHVGGTIKGRYGHGTWSSPTLLCGGVWHAEKEK